MNPTTASTINSTEHRDNTTSGKTASVTKTSLFLQDLTTINCKSSTHDDDDDYNDFDAYDRNNNNNNCNNDSNAEERLRTESDSYDESIRQMYNNDSNIVKSQLSSSSKYPNNSNNRVTATERNATLTNTCTENITNVVVSANTIDSISNVGSVLDDTNVDTRTITSTSISSTHVVDDASLLNKKKDKNDDVANKSAFVTSSGTISEIYTKTKKTKKKEVTSSVNNQKRQKRIRAYDDFDVMLTPSEDLSSVLADDDPPGVRLTVSAHTRRYVPPIIDSASEDDDEEYEENNDNNNNDDEYYDAEDDVYADAETMQTDDVVVVVNVIEDDQDSSRNNNSMNVDDIVKDNNKIGKKFATTLSIEDDDPPGTMMDDRLGYRLEENYDSEVDDTENENFDPYRSSTSSDHHMNTNTTTGTHLDDTTALASNIHSSDGVVDVVDDDMPPYMETIDAIPIESMADDSSHSHVSDDDLESEMTFHNDCSPEPITPKDVVIEQLTASPIPATTTTTNTNTATGTASNYHRPPINANSRSSVTQNIYTNNYPTTYRDKMVPSPNFCEMIDTIPSESMDTTNNSAGTMTTHDSVSPPDVHVDMTSSAEPGLVSNPQVTEVEPPPSSPSSSPVVQEREYVIIPPVEAPLATAAAVVEEVMSTTIPTIAPTTSGTLFSFFSNTNQKVPVVSGSSSPKAESTVESDTSVAGKSRSLFNFFVPATSESTAQITPPESSKYDTFITYPKQEVGNDIESPTTSVYLAAIAPVNESMLDDESRPITPIVSVPKEEQQYYVSMTPPASPDINSRAVPGPTTSTSSSPLDDYIMLMDHNNNNNNNSAVVDGSMSWAAGGRLWQLAGENAKHDESDGGSDTTSKRQGAAKVFTQNILLEKTRSCAEVGAGAVTPPTPPRPIRSDQKQMLALLEEKDREEYLFRTGMFANKRVRVAQLLMIGLVGILFGWLGNFFVNSSCHFASVAVPIGQNGEMFSLHYGLWNFSPVDSAVNGYKYCYPYIGNRSSDAPIGSRVFNLLALILGTYSLVVLWCYLITGRALSILWRMAVVSSMVAGLFQFLTLYFFFGTVCQNNNCFLGPGSIVTIITALAWITLSAELFYNCPLSAPSSVERVIGDEITFAMDTDNNTDLLGGTISKTNTATRISRSGTFVTTSSDNGTGRGGAIITSTTLQQQPPSSPFVSMSDLEMADIKGASEEFLYRFHGSKNYLSGGYNPPELT